MRVNRNLILIVDDSKSIREKLRSILVDNGFEVIIREEGEGAVQAALEYFPDLILMDYNMPGMDGLAASRMLKKYSQTRAIPIALFTDTEDIKNKVKSFQIGVEDYILKGIDHKELVARISGLLNWKTDRDKIIREKDKLSGLLDNFRDAVAIVNHEGQIMFFNRSAADRFGFVPEVIKAGNLKDVLPECEESREILLAVEERRELEELELEISRCDRQRIYTISIRRVELDYTEDIGAAVIFTDITGEKEAEKLKAEFHSMIAHEMRTPISVILGYANLILEGNAGDVSDMQQEFLQGISGNGEVLRKLVDDFLEVSRLENKFVNLDVASFDMVELIAKTVKGLRLLAENKDLKLEFNPAGESIMMNGDSDKLEHALINIIENAIKYTEEGGVTVECFGTGEGVEVRVSDTGIGMSEEEMETIFRSFERLEKAQKKKIKGTGLGLAIVKEIINAHQGQIRVESRESKGSTFIIDLPSLDEGENSPVEAAETCQASSE
ncbi:MAG: response regulator [Candidatus Latescibacteria bacterium]|nr:response regulator [bacterium]MBD3423388.1 response regulator [Candidatus Latescibacterota bacterium]